MWAWAALGVAFALAAAANLQWNFGARTPGGWFLYWYDARIELGLAPLNTPGLVAEPRHAPPRRGLFVTLPPGMDYDVIRAALSGRLAMSILVWHPAIPPLAFCLMSWFMTRSRPPGRCPACGYDLTGLPPGASGSPVCPECGRAG